MFLSVCLCLVTSVLGENLYPDQKGLPDDVMKDIFALPYNFPFSKISCDTVKFVYFTPGSNKTINITSENASQFISNNSSIKIIINGWLHTPKTNWIVKLAETLLKTLNDTVVIAVDWSAYSLVKDATVPLGVIKPVGECVGKFIKDSKLNPKKIHIIGHSFGAQVSSFVANSLGRHKLQRITGLDPGAPGFEYPHVEGDNRRLTEDDACTVDVIHTGVGYRGVVRPCGTIDFYVNGGYPQPGCSEDKIESCSHQYVHVYFTLSITEPKRFRGISVRNNKIETAYMGYWITPNANGIFYVCANASEVDPYTGL